MDSNLKALIAKAWKDEDLDLEPGSHYLDEVLDTGNDDGLPPPLDRLSTWGHRPRGKRT